MSTAPHEPSRACYLRGCRHPECELANYRYMSRLRLDLAHGKSRLTDATQTTVHAERLLANGWSRAQIARVAGLSTRTIDLLFQGRRRISNTTARAVLSIPIAPPPQAPLRDIDATGSRRRLQALVAIGYPILHLAPRIGINHSVLCRIAAGGRPRVHASTASAITRQYRHLCRTPGPSDQARAAARRRGWHGPLAWDDIDDPAAQPEICAEEPDMAAPGKRTEVEHLGRFGIPEDEIEARTGACRSYVKQVVGELYTGRTVRRSRSVTDRPPLNLGAASHGRSGYTLGCRCRTCRDGAAEAMRSRRATAKEAA